MILNLAAYLLSPCLCIDSLVLCASVPAAVLSCAWQRGGSCSKTGAICAVYRTIGLREVHHLGSVDWRAVGEHPFNIGYVSTCYVCINMLT